MQNPNALELCKGSDLFAEAAFAYSRIADQQSARAVAALCTIHCA
jgi:hypothetical protein